MVIKISLEKNKPVTFAYIVGAMYRQALINIGFSPDTHIYDLPLDRIKKNHSSSSGKYILRVAKTYESLEGLEKDIFLNDFLEKGRHYRFWYLSRCNSRDYGRARKNTLRDISSLIKKETKS